MLLYELLTGTTPFEARQLLEAGWDEMRRVIREQEPVRPSTRLTRELVAVPHGKIVSRKPTSGRAIPTQEEVNVEARRRLRLKEQIHLVRGDLDWVVMKCLEKDRSRRYETAHALVQDIERYLRHQPVLAAPPNRMYRAGKFWRRHRARIATTMAVTALLLGLIATIWVYHQSAHAQRVQRAKEVALPEIMRLIQAGDYPAAFSVAEQARSIIPRDPVLSELRSRICREYSIVTTPPGAAIVNGKIYAIGGVAQGGWEPALAIVEEYDPMPTVLASRSGSTLRISWNGILETSDNLDGTHWQALNPATWPFSVSLQSAPMKFYRARQP